MSSSGRAGVAPRSSPRANRASMSPSTPITTFAPFTGLPVWARGEHAQRTARGTSLTSSGSQVHVRDRTAQVDERGIRARHEKAALAGVGSLALRRRAELKDQARVVAE